MSRHVVVRTIQRPSPDVVERLAAAGVATVHEAMGGRGLTGTALSPVQHSVRIGGPAITVSCQAGDNLMIHAAIELLTPGDVLVVTTTSRSTDGMFGELLATSARAAGAIGLVTDAGVRDTAELNQMGFPVWARAIHAQGTVKATGGSVNVPVVLDGCVVAPGDVVVADDDGIVVVPRAEAGEVADVAETRLAREAGTRERLADGELGLDIYGFRARLADLGVAYLDDETQLLGLDRP